MRRTLAALIAAAVAVGALSSGCDLFKKAEEEAKEAIEELGIEIKLTNSFGESLDKGVGYGDTIYLEATTGGKAEPETVYYVEVFNKTKGQTIVEINVMTDGEGNIPRTALIHDVGESVSGYPSKVSAGDDIIVKFGKTKAPADGSKKDPLPKDEPILETPPVPVVNTPPKEDVPVIPHVYAAALDASTGSYIPETSFVIGVVGDGEHSVNEIYVVAENLPSNVTEADVYIFEDRDDWKNGDTVSSSASGFVAMTAVTGISGGKFTTPKLADWSTSTFDPTKIGTYDIVVDFNNKGVFDHDISVPWVDGLDNNGGAGFTIQYSKGTLANQLSAHIITQIAYDSSQRWKGTWKNTFSTGGKVFAYTNPPVRGAGDHNLGVYKYVVKHQDFNTFWNNTAPTGGVAGFGRVELTNDIIITNPLKDHPQWSCTNEPPFLIWIAKAVGDATAFDIVIDLDQDGYYDIGRDFLDCIGDTGDPNVDQGRARLDPSLIASGTIAADGGFKVQ
ncbi:MAG: hypothetical protein ACUVXI_15200 [bacterium]